MNWKKGKWYTLCLECFSKHHKEGGWCYGAGRRCSICSDKGVAEFYPVTAKIKPYLVGSKRKANK